MNRIREWLSLLRVLCSVYSWNVGCYVLPATQAAEQRDAHGRNHTAEEVPVPRIAEAVGIPSSSVTSVLCLQNGPATLAVQQQRVGI